MWDRLHYSPCDLICIIGLVNMWAMKSEKPALRIDVLYGVKVMKSWLIILYSSFVIYAPFFSSFFFFFNSYEQHGSTVWMTSANHPGPDWNILYFQWIARKFFLFMVPIQFIPWLLRWLRLRLTFQVLDVFLWDFVIHALLWMKGSKTVCCLKLFQCALGSHEGIER